MALNNQDSMIELTFHYVNGQTESFNIVHRADGAMTAQDFQQKIMRILEKPWCVMHLQQQTICIKTAHLLKVEVKPSVPQLQGEGVFSDVRRVTALARSTQR